MQFPIGQVPLPERARPLQPPPFVDPAGIIMQAAALRQQRELTQQNLNQQALEHLTGSLLTSQHLQLQRQQAEAHQTLAEAALQMQEQKLSPEIMLMQAHANYFNQMAVGGEGAVEGAVKMLQSGLASPQDIYSLASRWPQNAKVRLMSTLANSGIDLKGQGLDLLAQRKGIETQQGTVFQQRIRAGESILPNFQNVVDMARNLGLATFAPANKIKLAALRQINDPSVAKYDAARQSVSEEMARYFGGGVASDMKIKLGQSILGNDGANADAIQEGLLGKGGAYEVIQNQINAYKKGQQYQEPPQTISNYSGMTDDQLRGLGQIYGY